MQERNPCRRTVEVHEIDTRAIFYPYGRLKGLLQRFTIQKMQIILGSVIHKEDHQDEDEFKWNKN